MTCHAHIHEISGRRHNNLPVCPMKDSHSWSHMSRRTNDENRLQNFGQSVQKQQRESKEEKTRI